MRFGRLRILRVLKILKIRTPTVTIGILYILESSQIPSAREREPANLLRLGIKAHRRHNGEATTHPLRNSLFAHHHMISDHSEMSASTPSGPHL